jgi:hypothetical protein
MPRSRPGALRARQPRHLAWASELPAPIHGLSARTGLAIHVAEVLDPDYYVFPGATKRALRRYREFVTPAGRRPRYPQDGVCSCRHCSFDDVRHARDVLDQVLRALPARARAELKRLVAPLDAAFLDRTLPDPFADRQWGSEVWWRRRLSGGMKE